MSVIRNKIRDNLSSQLNTLCKSISYLAEQGYLINNSKFVKLTMLDINLHIIDSIGFFECNKIANSIVDNINQSLIL